ncbi:MAG: sulfur carrier protein ThiS [Paracoccaceae bacterium]|jgi:sulfur carrier protein|nr:sulfur carrier protein ThiS [Paracoccaceae bacterium]MDP5348935.1 sulfur carrier protein ThiS [Paracoccaceae bacterium]
MRIDVNGETREVDATTLADALVELGWGDAKVATALNGDFVPATARATQTLRDGDRIEVLAPMQGG